MSGLSREEFLCKLRDALLALNELNLSSTGPFISPKQTRVYVVDGCPLTESEIVLLHQGGHFTPEKVKGLLKELKFHQMNERREVQPNIEPGPLGRRRSQRVMLRVAVVVKAEMPAGNRLQTRALTVVVNAHGALMESPHRMTVGQRITLVNPQTGKEVACRVVSVERSSEEFFRTAFEFDQRNPKFWPVSFPSLDWGEA
jgi:hypothetical protein